MFRFIRSRDFIRLFLILTIATLVIAPSILIPLYLERGIAPVEIAPSAPEDNEFLDALRDAYLLERSGDLPGALVMYRLAGGSGNAQIQEAARQGADRTYARLAEINRLFPDYQKVLTFSLQARTPLLGVLVVVLAVALLSRTGKRRGIALRPFSITPQVEGESDDAFNHMLAENLAAIVRVYESAQLGRIGVQITMPDLVSEGEGGDILSRALASLREGGLTTASAFSIAEILRYFQTLGERPEYRLSGSVTILPKEARAQAKLARVAGGKVVAVWEASSREILAVPSRSAPAGRTGSVSWGASPWRLARWLELNDPRQNARYLSDLSLVLASKIWHSLAQGAQAEMRPSTWQTVYQFVRAMNALEGAE